MYAKRPRNNTWRREKLSRAALKKASLEVRIDVSFHDGARFSVALG
jgi:hypothetical protein